MYGGVGAGFLYGVSRALGTSLGAIVVDRKRPDLKEKKALAKDDVHGAIHQVTSPPLYVLR